MQEKYLGKYQNSPLNVPVARGTGPRERWSARTMARDRPSPYDEVPFFPVARGPVPRDLHRQEVAFWARRTEENKRRFFRSANDGEGQVFPPPYGEVPFFSRSAGACPPRSLERADAGEGNPRMRVWHARPQALR